MSLRARIAVTAAVAVAVAVLLVSVAVYGATARQLRGQVDAELAEAARVVRSLPAPAGASDRFDAFRRLRDRRSPTAGPDRFVGRVGVGTVQVVGPDGSVRVVGPFELPVDDAVRSLAAGGGAAAAGGAATPRTVAVDGVRLRVLAVPAGDLGALQLALPLTDVERALAALRRQLVLTGVLGVGLAGLLGGAVAARAVRPVRRLTDAAEEVGRTQDLAHRISVEGDDELGRLATAFNDMLASLDAARTAQQQLVADASHELRTPLTSLRTNIEVMQLDRGELDPGERAALLEDVALQLGEFGRLVDGLVELARGDRPAVAPTPVALGTLVADVVERVAVFHPDVPTRVDVDDSVVVAERDRLERAVANLVDNACKHGAGAPVEVVVRDGVVRVRDHGPGIDERDVEHVFDRFYRSPTARSRPGSGLGLSIVAQVAAAHGGTATAGNAPGGGAVLTLSLPRPAAPAS